MNTDKIKEMSTRASNNNRHHNFITNRCNELLNMCRVSEYTHGMNNPPISDYKIEKLFKKEAKKRYLTIIRNL